MSDSNLGIVLSDEQVQHVKYIQSMLSDSLKEDVSFEDTVSYLLLYGIDAQRLSHDVYDVLSCIECVEIIQHMIQCSVCLEDYT
ncbi:hypothetical protein [Candidatus Nitrosopumilus sediminis]|uniref:Uncharacterized protein n=1 Tax=Candidatus Nitrosopumilus sediminis TaxID=1229909 RepID=K0B741_9ARCH|nr:hypothetical protein [Candidatus Nitrosopumilus sediminis]AFS81913.1 hypothetical protein NSED_00505 [Candidatus Nitrosopumilus sediminis]